MKSTLIIIAAAFTVVFIGCLAGTTWGEDENKGNISGGEETRGVYSYEKTADGGNTGAADRRGPGKRDGRRGPPEEAIEACEGMALGDACSFTTPRGDQVEGTCRKPRGDRLACAPDNHGGPGQGPGGDQGGGQGPGNNGPGNGPGNDRPGNGPGGQGPPDEAIDACQGMDEGDACSFATPRGDQVTGTCRSVREGMACVPDNHPGGGKGPNGNGGRPGGRGFRPAPAGTW